MLKLSGVDSYYDRSHVLHDFSLEVPDHGILAVLGRNGVGKTTAMKTIMGLTDRATGSITLDDVDLSQATTHERARAGIGYVPQGREIFPDFSIRENILMGCFARPDGVRRIPDLVPHLFPYLQDNLDRPGGVLSGGQQQQLAIARALATDPKVLLLDEPCEGIQPSIVEEIENIILEINKKHGIAVVLVEQNVEFARRACDRFVIVEKGHVAASGTPEDLTREVVHTYLSV
ncbi:urea ABC transporter ATP-binding subunit UrtE [Pinisolibacter aquiterrae]|uniref:urea ABC transporter ATP-binding subunit UrtE n=1 Tax=Pinisolibacter aquiterrae TaxID=2815579 RepID=UPI001C3CA71B|nr:urea ABC transporter ATP-binding subunit UrtE [Pinisolibacter aquiterrae]MBV5262719.1 urea ABC transporter ATP-binding subunit UrtE [Pinisolibacter aquiterrae]MCC8233539.1 urea ABC transporter ATP-binding subunit UrtE [Pinisolibacter aquiterrae]